MTAAHHVCALVGTVGVGLLLTVGACTLDGPKDDVGEPCIGDVDCPTGMECVVADSPNASRVCLPIE